VGLGRVFGFFLLRKVLVLLSGRSASSRQTSYIASTRSGFLPPFHCTPEAERFRAGFDNVRAVRNPMELANSDSIRALTQECGIQLRSGCDVVSKRPPGLLWHAGKGDANAVRAASVWTMQSGKGSSLRSSQIRTTTASLFRVADHPWPLSDTDRGVPAGRNLGKRKARVRQHSSEGTRRRRSLKRQFRQLR
jgi:hypothetical protein